MHKIARILAVALQRRLYLRFLACRGTSELSTFVNQLTFEQYPLLSAGIEQARSTASDQDRAEIIERQNEVYRLWAERPRSSEGETVPSWG